LLVNPQYLPVKIRPIFGKPQLRLYLDILQQDHVDDDEEDMLSIFVKGIAINVSPMTSLYNKF